MSLDISIKTANSVAEVQRLAQTLQSTKEQVRALGHEARNLDSQLDKEVKAFKRIGDQLRAHRREMKAIQGLQAKSAVTEKKVAVEAAKKAKALQQLNLQLRKSVITNKAAETAIAKHGSKIKKTVTDIDSLRKAMARAKGADYSGNMGKQIGEQQAQMKRLNGTLKRYQGLEAKANIRRKTALETNRALGQRIKLSTQEYKAAQRAIAKQSIAIGRLADQETKMALRIAKSTAARKSAHESIKKTQRGIKQNSESTSAGMATLKKFNKGLKALAVAAGIAYAAIKLINTVMRLGAIGAEFEQEMAIVQAVSISTQLPLQQQTAVLREMSAAAMEMGRTTRFSATEAASALRFLGMAGLTAQESIASLQGTLQLATVGELSLKDAADLATNILAGFRLEVEELNSVNSILANISTKSNTNVRQLAEAMKYAAPIASNLGFKVDEVSAMLGVLANAGIKSYDAGTDMRQAFTRMNKVIEESGVKFSKTATTAEKFVALLRKMRTEQWNATKVHEKFGMIAQKSILVLKDNIEVYERLLAVTRRNKTAAADMADTIANTVATEWLTLKSALEDVRITLFQLFAVDVRGFFASFTKLIRDNRENIISAAVGIAEMGRVVYRVVKAALWPFYHALRAIFMLFERLTTIPMLEGTSDLEKRLRSYLEVNKEAAKTASDWAAREKALNNELKLRNQLIQGAQAGTDTDRLGVSVGVKSFSAKDLDSETKHRKALGANTLAEVDALAKKQRLVAEIQGMAKDQRQLAIYMTGLAKQDLATFSKMTSQQKVLAAISARDADREISKHSLMLAQDKLLAKGRRSKKDQLEMADLTFKKMKDQQLALSEVVKGSKEWYDITKARIEEDKSALIMKAGSLDQKKYIALQQEGLKAQIEFTKWKEKEVIAQREALGLQGMYKTGEALQKTGGAMSGSGASGAIGGAISSAGNMISGAASGIASTIGGLAGPIGMLIKLFFELPAMIREAFTKITDVFNNWADIFRDLPDLFLNAFQQIGEGINRFLTNLLNLNWWGDLVENLIKGFRDMFLNLFGVNNMTRAKTDKQEKALSGLAASMDGYFRDKARQDWGYAEWKQEYDRLEEVRDSLPRDSNYWDNYIDASKEQFEVLKKMEENSQKANEFLNTIKDTLHDTYYGLIYGDLAPTKNLDEFRTRFDELVNITTSEDKTLAERGQALNDLSGFAEQYLQVANDFLKSSSGYQTVFDYVTNTIGSIAGIEGVVAPGSSAIGAGYDPNARAPESTRRVDITSPGTVAEVGEMFDLVQKILEALKSVIQPLINIAIQIKDLFKVVLNVISDVWIAITKIPEQIGRFITDLWHAIISLPGQIWDFVKQLPAQIWSLLQGLGQLIADAITSSLGGGGSGIGGLPSGHWSGLSDRRLKKNVTYGEDVLPGVPSAAWEWNDKAKALGLSGKSSGVIAQDLERVRPDLVGRQGAFKDVDYGGLSDIARFANGGISTGPQLAMVSEWSANAAEAHVPLPDGKSIPVTMNGGGSKDVLGPKLDVMIDRLGELIDVTRAGSEISVVIEQGAGGDVPVAEGSRRGVVRIRGDRQ